MRTLQLILVVFLISCSSGEEKKGEPGWETDVAQDTLSSISVDEPSGEDRTSWQNPALVIEHLGPVDGKIVADIGAGTGYFTFLLADAGARVIAIDIDEEYLNYIQTQLQETDMLSDQSIETRLSKPESPLLVKDEVDVALLVNTYTFLPNRTDYLKEISFGLKSGGIVCIVDYKSANVPVISEETPVLPVDVVQQEMISAGYKIINRDTSSLKYQYILTATPSI